MKEIISLFKQKGYLLSPDIMNMDEEQLEMIYSKIKFNPFNLKIIDSAALKEIQAQMPLKSEIQEFETKVEILKSFDEDDEKKNINSFISLYNDRYNRIGAMLRNRPELSNANSAKAINESKDSNEIAFIGIVSDVSLTKNNNFLISMEDPSGSVKVMITEKDPELYKKAQDVILDEVLGISGTRSRGYIFANKILFPDIPNTYEFKKSPDEVYVAFVSDIHMGSATFMEESFKKFIDWINGKTGSAEQREIASKIGYMFVNGDVVDGVGVYPSQEEDLAVKDIYEQFGMFSNFMKQIPERIQIILTPGNHDNIRLGEPQPPYRKKFLPELYEMKNIHFVSNPAYIRIHALRGFSGFTVLSYHGYSFDHYCLDVESLRNAGGYGAVEKVVEFLLKKRHLAPTHGSTVLLPYSSDRLVIDIVPDIVTTGHVHNFRTGSYNHISIIACGCFERLTGETYAEKLGHKPTPALVPVLNLKTRKITVMDFN